MGYKKLIQSGDLVEYYEYRYDYIPRRIKSRTRTSRCKSTYTRNRRPDNLFRLKRGFVRLVRSNLVGSEAPLLLTFTMFETVEIGSAYHSFSRFICRLRVKYGKGFRYIAVPEFQKDVDYYGKEKANGGAVHFHALFWSLPTSPRKERRSRAIQRAWGRGFVDVVSTDGSVKLAGYIGKYLFKALSDKRLLAKKAYCSSRNVLRPVSVASQTLPSYLGYIVGDSVPEKVCTFNTQWLGDCRYSRYLIG